MTLRDILTIRVLESKGFTAKDIAKYLEIPEEIIVRQIVEFKGAI